MATVLIIALCLVLSYVLFAGALYAGVRMMKSPVGTMGRALGVTGLILVVNVVVLVGCSVSPVFQFLGLLVQVGMDCWLIAWLFRLSALRAFLAWLVVLGCNIAAVVFTLVVIRPFVMEAFSMPTNGMAPAVIGLHYEGVCPSCGGTLIVGVPLRPEWREEESLGICEKCSKRSMVRVRDLSQEVKRNDRILVAKFLTPRRWDAIAYKDVKSGQIYIKRLLGLPGETVCFDEGKLVIDGKEMAPPAELPRLTYGPIASEIFHYGRPDAPTRLGADEYFVVGDFSEKSSDSRSVGPVPAGNCIGVMTAIYWPMGRMRVFR